MLAARPCFKKDADIAPVRPAEIQLLNIVYLLGIAAANELAVGRDRLRPYLNAEALERFVNAALRPVELRKLIRAGADAEVGTAEL